MGVMKNTATSMETIQQRLKLVARFGAVRLLRDRFGRATMTGEGEEASGEVKEWIALFGHELVLTNPVRRSGALLQRAR